MATSSLVNQLQRAIADHPGLVLDGDDRRAFLEEASALGILVRTAGLDEEALIACAWALRKLGRFPEAHEVVGRALARGRTWKALTADASVYRAEGKVDAAVALYEEAAALDPTDTAALTEAAQALGEAGRHRDAAERFGRAADRDPRRTDARAWQEYALFLVDRDPARTERVRAIAAREPGDGTASYLLAWMEAPLEGA